VAPEPQFHRLVMSLALAKRSTPSHGADLRITELVRTEGRLSAMNGLSRATASVPQLSGMPSGTDGVAVLIARCGRVSAQNRS